MLLLTFEPEDYFSTQHLIVFHPCSMCERQSHCLKEIKLNQFPVDSLYRIFIFNNNNVTIDI